MSLTEETALDIIVDALDDISVHMDETTLGASDARTGMKAINRIMATFSANGVDLGFTKITKIGDVITIPDGAMDALVSLLAFRLWPKYRTPQVTASVVSLAREGAKQIYRIGISVTTSSYPCTLPVGAGNSFPGDTHNTFYPCAEDSALSEDSFWNNDLDTVWDNLLNDEWDEV